MTDLAFSKILHSIKGQAKNLEYVINTVNYSNNEMGPKSIALIDDLINSTYYNSLSNLRLSNLRMNEASISQLF